MAGELGFVRNGVLDAFGKEFSGVSGDAIRIETLPFRCVLNLRSRATRDFAEAIEMASGVELPVEPNRWNGDGDRSAIWLGPDEWLLIIPDGEAEAIEQAIRAARSNDPWLSVVDVSHNYTWLLLSGSRVRDLLAKGCALDLHSRVFVPGDCAQSLLAKSRVILRALDNVNSTELCIRNSYGPYTAQWLLDASGEFQTAEAAQP